jgi:Tfp pilus assembly protein PilF
MSFVGQATQLLVAVSLLNGGRAVAQGGCDLHLFVLNFSGRPQQVRVLLVGSASSSRTGQTDTSGQTTFLGLPRDDFTLVVFASNPGVEEHFSTRSGDCFQSITVRLPNKASEISKPDEVFVGDLNAPPKARRLYDRALAHLHHQEWAQSRHALEQAVAIHPMYARAFNALGVAAAEEGEFSVADDAFRRAIKLRPKYSEAYLNFAKFLRRQEKLDEAETVLDQLLLIDVENREARTLVTECLFDQKRYADLIRFVQDIHVRRLAHDPDVHRYASEVFRREGMTQEFASQVATLTAEVSKQH